MQNNISSYLKNKLGKEYKYDISRYNSIYKCAIEEYNKDIKNLSEEIALEKVREFIDLEVAKLKPKSRLFFPMLVSVVALLVASIECILLSIHFSFIAYELFFMTIVFLFLLIYAYFFKKNKSKWLFSIFLYVGSWLLTLVWLLATEPAILGMVTDTGISTSLIFPCVFKLTIYNFLTVHYKNSIYFNWIISLISSVTFIILFCKEIMQNKRAD